MKQTKRLFLSLIFLSAGFYPMNLFSENFEGRKIQKVGIVVPSDLDPSELKQELSSFRGQGFSSKKIDAALRRLYLSGRFHNISVHVTPKEGNQIDISFVFELSRKIDSIEFKGANLFSDVVLLKSLASKEGGFFSEQTLVDDKKALLSLYEEGGYFQTDVQIKFSAFQKPHLVQVVFEIKEGIPALIEKITFNSVGRPKSKHLRPLLSLQEGTIFFPKTLKQDLLSLKNYLFKKLYLEARIFPEKVIFNPDKSRVHVFVRLAPGSQHRFEFEGVAAFSSSDLLSPLSKEGAGAVSLEDIASHILSSYRQEGFYHVQLSQRVSLDEKRNEKIITFMVQESHRVEIQRFLIRAQHLDEAYYQNLLRTLLPKRAYVPQNMESLSRSLKDHLRSEGFLFANVSILNLNWDADRKSVAPEILIEEGPQTLIKDVRFQGNRSFSRERLLKEIQLSLDTPLNPAEIDTTLNRIIEFYQSHGFLKIKLENTVPEKLIAYSADRKAAYLHIQISEGPQVKIGNIIFRGTIRTRHRVLERELTFHKSDLWNPKEIQRTESQILHLGLFSGLRIQPLSGEFQSGENDMLIEITERRPGMIEVGSGFKTDDGIHGYSGVAYRNIGGWNRVISARGEVNRKLQNYKFLERKIDLGFSEPYLASIPFIARFNLIHKKEATLPFDARSWEGKFSLDKGLWDFLRLTLQYSFEHRDIFRALDSRDIQKKGIASLGSSVLFDFRDNPFNPAKGSSHSFSSFFFLPKIGSAEEANLARNLLTTSWYFTPWSWITFALSGRGGYAHSFSSIHPIPVDQRFYLGGRATIRGFKEDDIGSDTKNRQIFETFLLNYKSELQFHIFSDFGVALFLDGGNVFFDNPASHSRFRHSVGPGLRYATPIGPMNLDFGFILARNKEAGEPIGRFHFSIGLF
ncbi:MAG: BamA/TamA family outer membrane protein [Deltaproteobacteria bacterium]|nr:BamA/TamA family outer membrane protein [Deltaproteobacteria bacterium]